MWDIVYPDIIIDVLPKEPIFVRVCTDFSIPRSYILMSQCFRASNESPSGAGPLAREPSLLLRLFGVPKVSILKKDEGNMPHTCSARDSHSRGGVSIPFRECVIFLVLFEVVLVD
jgi:hypothetical protein